MRDLIPTDNETTSNERIERRRSRSRSGMRQRILGDGRHGAGDVRILVLHEHVSVDLKDGQGRLRDPGVQTQDRNRKRGR